MPNENSEAIHNFDILLFNVLLRIMFTDFSLLVNTVLFVCANQSERPIKPTIYISRNLFNHMLTVLHATAANCSSGVAFNPRRLIFLCTDNMDLLSWFQSENIRRTTTITITSEIRVTITHVTMSSAPLTLYHFPPSSHSRAALWALRLLGIEVDVSMQAEYNSYVRCYYFVSFDNRQIKIVNLANKEHLADDFLRLNPQHCVPTLRDGNFLMWESRAIATYAAESRRPEHTAWPPGKDNVAVRARIAQRLYFDLGTLNARIRAICVSVIADIISITLTTLVVAQNTHTNSIRSFIWAKHASMTLNARLCTRRSAFWKRFSMTVITWPALLNQRWPIVSSWHRCHRSWWVFVVGLKYFHFYLIEHNFCERSMWAPTSLAIRKSEPGMSAAVRCPALRRTTMVRNSMRRGSYPNWRTSCRIKRRTIFLAWIRFDFFLFSFIFWTNRSST